MKTTIKQVLLLTTIGLLALPLTTGALTVRTEHRSSSGGVTAAEGSATVTGDQSSSVNVETVVTGSRGTVQITTEKDGVTTTETHNINGSGSGGTVIVTPTPPAEDSGGRTPRGDRGTVAIRISSNSSAAKPVSVQTKSAVPVTKQVSKNIQHSVLAMVNSGAAVDTPLSISMPMPVLHMPEPVVTPNSFTHFFARIFSIIGLGV